MWFDVRKLLASANFQEDLATAAGLGDIGAPPVGGSIDPTGGFATAGPGTTPSTGFSDALGPAAAPVSAPASLYPSLSAPSPFEMGGLGYVPPDAGANPFGDTTAPADTSVPTPTARPPGADTSPTAPAAPADTGYKTEADKITGATPGRATQPGTATLQPAAGNVGGAAGANAVTQFANALRGVAQAAQNGNPQAQQIMNLLRQLQQQGMLQQGMGGQQYNPYMNQFNNPWESRRRMEQMRREFMERARLRRELYGHGAGRPGTAGGGRGRR